MLTIDQLRNSVDCFTGQPAFAIPVVDIPGRNNLNLSIAIGYGGPAWPQASSWNLDAPTGVLGLGWSLPLQGVFAICGQSGAPAAMGYMLAWRGGARRLFCTGQAANGDLLYGTDAGDFWKISYRQAAQTWTVIDEDGITHVFGDAFSGRNTVTFNVAWDNWIGASNRSFGQTSIATGWLLNNSHDWLGDAITYRYATTPVAVGTVNGQSFTQAVVLQSAVAVDGSRAVFSYAAKTAGEYTVAHQNPSPPNAYQDAINTQYLDHIDVSANDGTLLDRVQFSYPGTLLGAATYPKRVLTGIQSGTPGAMLPGVQFSYWGQNNNDGVSATQIYNATTKALYGAIRQVTLPTGGSVAYAYTQTSGLQYGARKLTLVPPQGNAGSPVFYFEDNYVVVTWLGTNNSAYIQAYTWNGRWISTALGALPVGSAAGYAAMQVVTAANGFAACGGGQLHLYQVNATAIGQWVQPAVGNNPVVTYYQPTFTGGEATTLAVGDGFAALLGLTSGTLYRYRWVGTSWANDAALTIGGSGAALTLCARGSMLVALAGATTSSASTVYLYRRDMTGAWSAQQRSLALGTLTPQQVALVMTETFAAVMSQQSVAGNIQVGTTAIWWSADLSSVQSSVFPMQSLASGATPALPQIAGSVIAVGQTLYRFDGVQWGVYHLGAVTYAGYTVPTMSLGADVAIRRIANAANSAAVYDISTYDPNTGAWTTLRNSATSAALAIAAPATAGATGNYSIVAGTLNYLQPSGSWSATSVVLPSTLTLADANTAQVLGSNYLIYQSGTGTGSVATNVMFLRNGSAATAASGALAQQNIVVSGKPVNALVGRDSFVTYTGTFGTAGSQLTLYRAVNGDMTAVQTAYVVATLTSDNGFSGVANVNATVVQGYAFNATAATINPSGTTPAFNMTTVIPGPVGGSTPNGSLVLYLFNGLGPGENPVVAYPTGGNTNASQYPTAVVGAPYLRQAMPATGGTAVSSATSYLWVSVTTLGATGLGAYVRKRQSDDLLDGVTRTSSATYESNTGLPATLTVNNVTGSGQAEQVTQTMTYFSAQYDPQYALNLLTPVIEVVESVTIGGASTTTSQTIQTWRNDWGAGSGQWAPERVFRATIANPSAFNAWQWTQASPPPSSGWLQVQTVAARSAHGVVVQASDVLGRATSIIHDTSGTEMVAAGFGASVNGSTLSWYGCQPYETTGPWASSNPSLTIADYLTTADHHTGTQCLGLPATLQGSSAFGPKASFVPSDQNARYLFSCWARPAAGYGVANGRAQWSIQPFDPATGTNVGSAIVVILTPDPPPNQTVVPWIYVSQLLDLPSLKNASPSKTLGFTMIATNANTGATCYLDELRFMPLETQFAARVYDSTSWRVTANIGADGQAQQIVYDAYHRPIAQIGPNQTVVYLAMPTLSRALTPADVFSPQTPNSILTVSTTQTSLFDDFRGDSIANWTCTDATHWTVANDALAYTGTGSGTGIGPLGATAQFNKFAFTNFAARIDVSTGNAPTQSLAIGNGLLFMRWNPSLGQWELVELTGAGFAQVTLRLSSKAVQGFRDNMMFVMIDNFALGYVDGVQLFSYQYRPPGTLPTGYGRVTLAAAEAATFDNLFLLDSPQISLTFADGLGTLMQQLNVQGFQPTASPSPPFAGQSIATVTGCFYDSLGRVSTARQATTASLDLQTVNSGGSVSTSLVNGNQNSYLYTSAGAPLDIPTYLGGTDGYTFATPSYETSVLSRPTQLVAPRDSGTVAADFTTGYQYSGSPSLASTGPVSGQTSNFLVDTSVYPFKVPSNGGLVTGSSIVMKDQLGRVISRRLGNATDGYLRTDTVYNDTAKTVQVQNPNYFAPPGNSAASTWTETYTYNYLNLLASRATANDGTTSFMYDDAGRVRFVLTAAGAALTPQRILYTRYDPLNRVVETGMIQDQHYSFGPSLQAKANTAAFPVVDPAKSSDPNYAAGAWRKALAYDTDGTQTRYLVGQLWQASINQNGGNPADTEQYGYDAFGNVTAKTVTMAALSTSMSYPIIFAYNGQNRLSQIVYPALDASNPTIAISYDRLGRMAGIGKPDPNSGVVDPNNPPPPPAVFYASYGYDSYGRLAAAALRNDPAINKPIVQTYSYTDGGWPTAVTGDYFSELISYTNGVNGTAYYTGQPASIATSYVPGASFTPAPTPYGLALDYNSHGRMLMAANTSDAGLTLKMTQGGFDANGNIAALSVGQTGSTYAYRSNAGKTISDQVDTVASSVNNTADFATATAGSTSVGGWTWGSNNRGLSGSGIVANDPKGGQSLMLAGGGVAHWELLKLASFLAPSGTYTLTSVVLTGPGFSTASGVAGWYAVLYGAAGPAAVVPLGAIAVNTNWTTITTTINLATLIASYGNGTTIVDVGLQLRNGLRNADGSTGPAIYVQSVALAGSTTTPAYGYDAIGNVSAAMSNNIYGITYDATTNRATTMRLGNAGGNQLQFSYGADDIRTLKTYQTGAGTPVTLSQTLTITGLDGNPLIEKTTGSGAGVRYYIPGANGTIATIENGALKYLIQDRLGSTRVVVDSTTSTAATIDYQPYGGPARVTGQPWADPLYTGQQFDGETGLYDFNARFYDPVLRRFYAADPGGQYASPYLYAGNDPETLVDPSGRDAIIRVNDTAGTIDVWSRMLLHGPDANAASVRAIQGDIDRHWNRHRYTHATTGRQYQVTFNTIVETGAAYHAPWYEKLVHIGNGVNYMNVNLTGGRSGVRAGFEGYFVNLGPGTAAHEFGHMLGLRDRYVETEVTVMSWIADNMFFEHGALEGYEDNLMNEHWRGHVFQSDIDEIVGPAVARLCTPMAVDLGYDESSVICRSNVEYYLTPSGGDTARIIGLYFAYISPLLATIYAVAARLEDGRWPGAELASNAWAAIRPVAAAAAMWRRSIRNRHAFIGVATLAGLTALNFFFDPFKFWHRRD